MSFLEALQSAREKAKADLLQKKSSVDKLKETNINTPIKEEVKTDVKSDTHITICLGDAIIKQSSEAMVKFKKLRGGTGSARRIAKAIASQKITHSQLKKAFNIQSRYNPKRPDWHIVGSYALHSLKALLDDGIELNKALNTPWKEYI